MRSSPFPDEWISHDRKISPYIWSHRVLNLSESSIGLVGVIAFVFKGWGHSLQQTLQSGIETPFFLTLSYFAILASIWKLMILPFDMGAHHIERCYALSKQSYSSWFWDQIKGILVGAVLGTVVLGLIYSSIHLSKGFWWLSCATMMTLFSILLAQLAPVLLIPIFFKLRPMESGPLKDRLFELSRRFGIQVKDVYHLGLGEKTEKGNAAFTGIGKTKRIMIGDTLYERFPADQVEAVFAHELGHQVHHDLWKGIGVGTLSLFLSFYLAWVLCDGVLPKLGATIEEPYGLFLFLIVYSIIQLPFGVALTIFSRYREYQADRFASQAIGMGEKLAWALEKLTLQNWGYFRPHPFVEFFTYSHPAPWRRILSLRGP